MGDLSLLLLALSISIEDVQAHVDSGEVPPHEAARLVELTGTASGYLHDYTSQLAGL